MRLFAVVGLALLASCSSKKQTDDPPADPPPVGALVHGDAGVTTVVTNVDPSGMHVDEGAPTPPVQPPAQPPRPGRPIDVTLRSTPPGASVAVDGTVLGNTPAFWNGEADGREHEFVFTMRGHAIARYRFVPVASGVIHGHLDPIREETDAGVPTPPPEVVPPRPPQTPSVNPPSAPPTLTTDGGAAAPIPGPVGPTPSAEHPGSATGPQP